MAATSPRVPPTTGPARSVATTTRRACGMPRSGSTSSPEALRLHGAILERSAMATSTAPKPITAPPSTAYKIVDVPEIHRDVIRRYGMPGTFVGPSEQESPWVPFGANAALRHLAFDVRHNIFSNILWVKSQGVVGTHKHRGTVVMMCLAGSVRYLEYDWVAGPGD